VRRSFKFRAYPTCPQERRAARLLADHCDLYNAALEERREAWRMGQHSITYGMQSGQLREIRQARPWRSGPPLVHGPAADPPSAQCRIRRVLRARSEGEGGLSAVQALQPVRSGGIRRRRWCEVDPRTCRRMGTGSIPGRWLGQGPPAPSRPRDGQVPAAQTRLPALVRHRHQRHRGRSAPSQRPGRGCRCGCRPVRDHLGRGDRR
jgi:hypothetical protein